MGTFSSAQAQAQVYVLKLQDEVDVSAARYFTRGFAAAEAAGADLVIVHLDTYGGRVDCADSIRACILKSHIPTAAFIDRNAASAGALIAIACDSIYMAPGASMGAATVVDQDGQPAIDKYQSYWRGVMRTTAEANGRNPLIAEKMVDQNLDLPGISPVGKVITFTNADAEAHGYSEGTLESWNDVIPAFGIHEADFVIYERSVVDKVIDFLNLQVVSALLLVLLFGGIFLEIKTAGVGKGAIVAILAAFLFFVPHYVNGLAESWEIAIFLLGVVLLALEIFVIPGFGVAGVLGLLFALTGVTVALLENSGADFETVTMADGLRALAFVLVLMCIAILLTILAARFIVTSKAAHPYVDQSRQDKADGYTALRPEFVELVGLEGEALTDMRPVGHVVIDGRQYDAEAHEGYITKGQRIMVERLKGVHLVVKKIATA